MTTRTTLASVSTLEVVVALVERGDLALAARVVRALGLDRKDAPRASPAQNP